MQKFNKEKYLRRKKFKKYSKCIYASVAIIFFGLLLVYFAHSKFSISKEEEVVKTTVGEFIYGDVVIGAYINGEYSKEIPKKDNGYVVEKVVCDNEAVGFWNYDKWSLETQNLTTRSKCNVYFTKGTVWNFNYTGVEQTLEVTNSGTYKLEVWGSQGGRGQIRGVEVAGGFGSYSIGKIKLNAGDTLYINVGGSTNNYVGGYNGGGNGNADLERKTYYAAGGGGGSTHIATKSGLLSSLSGSVSSLLIVAGGGGGAANGLATGGSAGGYIGNNGSSADGTTTNIGYGGAQNFGGNADWDDGKGLFGIGGSTKELKWESGVPERFYAGGGGSGYYGGSAGNWTTDRTTTGSGGGGSGYIGNTLLTNQAMYCYNCSESSEENTKTISTTCSEETPTENCAKKGNGYARITFVDTP